MSNSKQDRQGARTPADLERKYNFGKTFEEVYGIAKSAQKSASEATVYVDKLDNSLNQEEIFKRLTTNDNGEKMQGVFMEDGEMYINAKYIANVEELFAKNITMTGKFTTTAEVFLEPGEEECAAMRKIIASHLTIPPTAEQLALYDANGDGTIDVTDLVKFRFACLGRASLIDLWEGTSELKKSTVTITIDISNPEKAIRMNGTNMWGREIDQYFGVNSAFMNDNFADTFNEILIESDAFKNRVTAIENGGTGGSTAVDAISNLGLVAQSQYFQRSDGASPTQAELIEMIKAKAVELAQQNIPLKFPFTWHGKEYGFAEVFKYTNNHHHLTIFTASIGTKKYVGSGNGASWKEVT